MMAICPLLHGKRTDVPLKLFWQTLGRYAALGRIALLTGRDRLAGRSFRHYGVSALLLALLPFYLGYHWLGLLLDEVLFRSYRRVRVDRPVFIVGVPRSGTTALHHALAADEQFTTFRTWECLFATSVTWRRFWWAVAEADRSVGRPLRRLVAVIERRLFRGLHSVHPMNLHTPEEDYFVFLPLLQCFILVVAFPDAPWLWRFGRFDTDIPPAQRSRLMTYYYRCVQRHLHAHGAGKRFLAKNPTFSPLVASLTKTFPDARMLCCLRDPREAVSSQLSVLDGPLRSMHGRYDVPAFQSRMADQLAFYYRHLLDVLSVVPAGRAILIPQPALRGQLAETVETAYRTLGLTLNKTYHRRLTAMAEQARGHDAGHRHGLRETHIDPVALRRRLDDVYHRFDFRGTKPVTAATTAATTAAPAATAYPPVPKRGTA